MPSTFANLLRYPRSSASEATENFTTEALAACIRADPTPMLRLLAAHSVIADPDAVTEVVAMTQVSYAGAGIIDLVLQLRQADLIEEVWVEVKVAAGGGLLGLAVTPPATILGVGFALPFWLAPIPLRTAVILRAWRRLR